VLNFILFSKCGLLGRFRRFGGRGLYPINLCLSMPQAHKETDRQTKRQATKRWQDNSVTSHSSRDRVRTTAHARLLDATNYYNCSSDDNDNNELIMWKTDNIIGF